MIECLWEDLYKLYTNTMPFHIKVLSSQGLWNSQKPWSQSPLDTEELVSGYHQIMVAWFILSSLLMVSVLNIFFHSGSFFSDFSGALSPVAPVASLSSLSEERGIHIRQQLERPSVCCLRDEI